MPAYDYDCAACGRRFEVIHGVHAEGPTTCPLCGKGPVRKAITAAAIHYKGSGWAKKERRATATPASAKASTDGPGGDRGSSSDTGSGEGDTAKGKHADAAPKSTEKAADGASDSRASASSD